MRIKTMTMCLSTATLAGLLFQGCATQSQIDKKIAAAQVKTDTKIESVSEQVEDLQERQRATDLRLDELSTSAQDALKRATEAGILAKGKVVFEQTFSEDRIRFKLGSYELNGDSKAALDELGARIKGLESPVYLEIQGHTDSQGKESSNDTLGQRRAEAVRRYLSKAQGLALGRMSTISYGESLPIGSNKSRAGRAQNRRVVVVALE